MASRIDHAFGFNADLTAGALLIVFTGGGGKCSGWSEEEAAPKHQGKGMKSFYHGSSLSDSGAGGA